VPEQRPLLGRVLRALAALAVGAAGASLALLLAARLSYRVGPFTVELLARPGLPATEIALPPLGEIRADTHLAPLSLTATLRSVDPDALNAAIAERGIDGLVLQVERESAGLLRTYALVAGLIAVLGAAAAAVLVYRADWRSIVGATAAGALLVATTGGLAWATYRPEAFQAPTYTGSLRLAPDLVGPIAEAGGRLEAFRAELDRLVRGTARAYGELASGPSPSEDATVVLHVSDIHASPLGMDLAQQLASTFDVDLVLDTGDITSFGTPLERTILDRIPQFDVPYVLVRGNHDSVAVATQVENLPNAEALESETIEVAGLTIMGAGHPLFTPNRTRTYTDEEIEEAVAQSGEDLAGRLEATGVRPDILAVHDDRMATPLVGDVPLVASGHFHRFDVRVEDGTILLRSGSTGAGGLDTFLGDSVLPLAAQILYFEGTPPELIAFDRVTLEPETRELTVDRELVGDLDATPAPTPAPS